LLPGSYILIFQALGKSFTQSLINFDWFLYNHICYVERKVFPICILFLSNGKTSIKFELKLFWFRWGFIF
jgi:hypothetical protein